MDRGVIFVCSNGSGGGRVASLMSFEFWFRVRSRRGIGIPRYILASSRWQQLMGWGRQRGKWFGGVSLFDVAVGEGGGEFGLGEGDVGGFEMGDEVGEGADGFEGELDLVRKV